MDPGRRDNVEDGAAPWESCLFVKNRTHTPEPANQTLERTSRRTTRIPTVVRTARRSTPSR
jgi:hypothetical protein